jgi:pimeloyl-ACP methyl ester carboxylesterase
MHTIRHHTPRHPTNAAANDAIHEAAAVRHLERPGGTIAFDSAGDGPLVVMLPGLGDLRQQYRFLAPDLVAAGHRAVSADLRGHGASSTGWSDYGSEAAGGDLIALIEALAAGPAVVIGTSFGAAPAVYAAAERPDLVSGLVLIGPFVRRQHTPAVMRGLLRVMTSGPWKVWAWGAFYDTLYPSAKPADHREHRRALLANLAEPGRFEALRGMVFRDDTAIEARLAAVRAPTLVVMGTKDPDFPDPAAEARTVADAVSGEVALIEGAGHYPHVEMPEATSPTIARFVGAAHGDAPRAAR